MLININSVSMGIVTTIIDNTKLRQIIIAYLKGIQVAKEKYATYSGRLKERVCLISVISTIHNFKG